MKNKGALNVRPMELKDIQPLADYWLLSPASHLVSMGVDLDKLPEREILESALSSQLKHPIEEKKSYALIWEQDGLPIGHTNVNQIEFGKQAYMHLHLWAAQSRQKGLGLTLVNQSLSLFFDNLNLQTIYCEPYALNPAPNKTLERLGFEFVKRHRTIPGSLNFEQDVHLWKLTRAVYLQKFRA